MFYIVQNSKLEGQPFEPPTSAQLAGSASVLVRVCPTTPTRCNSVAFRFNTRESVSNLGPQGQISCFISYRTQSWRVSRSSPPTSAQLAGSASVLVRVCPTTPTRCNPVAFGFKTRESVSNLGPQGQISCFYIVQNSQLEGQPFEPPTSAQLAGSASVLVRVCPTTPTRCNSVAFRFKTRESVSNLGPQGQISCFISYRTQSWRGSRSSPRPRPN